MRACFKAVTVVCLVGSVVASVNDDASRHAVLRPNDVLQRPYSDVLLANGAPLSTPVLIRRDVEASAYGAAAANNKNGTLDFKSWNAATGAACLETIRGLARSSNPSGNCICYNLPSLDLNTGLFEADLRLYRISDPRDEFASVSPESVKVGLQYHGASVRPVSEKDLMLMGFVRKQARKQTRDAAHSPRLVETYMFAGQIDAAKLAQNMTMAALEEVLIPTVTLSATTPRGANVNTSISVNEASFVSGIFSETVVVSDFSAAKAAVAAQLEALHNGTVAFVLPGVQLMIFPTGAIITSVWLFLGLVAYGVGTMERMNYAEMYSRGVANGQRR